MDPKLFFYKKITKRYYVGIGISQRKSTVQNLKVAFIFFISISFIRNTKIFFFNSDDTTFFYKKHQNILFTSDDTTSVSVFHKENPLCRIWKWHYFFISISFIRNTRVFFFYQWWYYVGIGISQRKLTMQNLKVAFIFFISISFIRNTRVFFLPVMILRRYRYFSKKIGYAEFESGIYFFH